MKAKLPEAFVVRQAATQLNNSLDVIPVHFLTEILEKQRHGARWDTAVQKTSYRFENRNSWRETTIQLGKTRFLRNYFLYGALDDLEEEREREGKTGQGGGWNGLNR